LISRAKALFRPAEASSPEEASASSPPDPNNSYTQRTDDLEICKHPQLQAILLPLLPSLLSLLPSPPSCFDDAFLIRYSSLPSLQRRLLPHVDGGDHTLQVALSGSRDYGGGGTLFRDPPPGFPPGPVHCERGEGLTFPAAMYHEGVAITSGER
jgi:hypothetical protein